jgi:spore germination protein KA
MGFLKRYFGKSNKMTWNDQLDLSQRDALLQKTTLTTSLEKNLKTMEQIIGPSYDYGTRNFRTGGKIPSTLVYMDGLVQNQVIEEILRALMHLSLEIEGSSKYSIITAALYDLLIIKGCKKTGDLSEIFRDLAKGSVALLFDGHPEVILCEAQGFNTRPIQEPSSEIVIRGPREGFVENIQTNTSLLRRHIRSPHLWIESMVIGKVTKTEIAIAYIKGLVSEELLQELRSRLERIETDGILESGYIEEFIEENPFTIFPSILRTERPDKVSGCLLEGRIAIITDGTPFVLIIPCEFTMFNQAPDDYYERFPVAVVARALRTLSLLITLLLPGFYVSVVNFHPELIPTDLLLRISATREGVPFPLIVEVILMEVIFELIREAGIRLPSAIGQAISIVGALILGDAAIRAGLVSQSVIIIIAITAIASFTIPVYSMSIALRIARFFITILAATFGLFGVQFGILVLLIHLCSVRSFGYPYLMPLGPQIRQDLKDNIYKHWRWGMNTRPKLLGGREPIRQKRDLQPATTKTKKE